MKILRKRRTDERAVEAVAMIFVIPVMVILVLALIDVGMMFRARMVVENITRDAVRSAAADGGLNNAHTNTIGKAWDTWLTDRLIKNHKCLVATCDQGQLPSIYCDNIDAGGNHYPGGVAQKTGDLIECEVKYPYKPINGELLNSPIGLGMGTLLKDFDIKIAARAETSAQGTFGAY